MSRLIIPPIKFGAKDPRDEAQIPYLRSDPFVRGMEELASEESPIMQYLRKPHAPPEGDPLSYATAPGAEAGVGEFSVADLPGRHALGGGETTLTRNRINDDFTRDFESLAQEGLIDPEPLGIMGALGPRETSLADSIPEPQMAPQPQPQPQQPTPIAQAAAPREVSKKPSPMEYVAQKRGIPLEALMQAQQGGNNSRLAANLGEAGDRIGSAIAGVQAQPEGFRNLAAQAGQGAKDVMALRKAETEDFNTQNASRAQDPNSPEAQAMRKVYGGVFSKLGIDPSSLDGMSAEAMKQVGSPASLAASLRNAELSGSKQDRIDARKKLSLGVTYQKMANGHPVVKEAEKVIQSAKQAQRIVQIAYSEGGQALSALQAKLPRMMGEVGVLTEQDVQRYVKNPQIVRGLMQTYEKAIHGKLTEKDRDNIIRLTQIMVEESENDRDQARGMVATQAASNMGLDPEEAHQLVNPASGLQPRVDQDDPRVAEAMKSGIPIEAIEQYMRDRGGM